MLYEVITRQLLTGGEALSPTHVRTALKCLPDVQLINGYGPTESTTFACCYRIPHSLEETRLSIPIGRPIANTRVYIFRITSYNVCYTKLLRAMLQQDILKLLATFSFKNERQVVLEYEEKSSWLDFIS